MHPFLNIFRHTTRNMVAPTKSGDNVRLLQVRILIHLQPQSKKIKIFATSAINGVLKYGKPTQVY